MKLVIVGPFGLRPHGTIGRRALPLAKALAARGHEVELVLPPWSCPEDTGRAWQEDGVQIHNIDLPPSVPVLREMVITLRLLRRVLRARPDVVHCFKPKAYAGLVALALWCLERVRLVRLLRVLDSDDWEGWGGWNEIGRYSWLQKRFFAWQESWGMRHSDALTVASKTLQSMAQDMGLEPRVVHYLPNGVDCDLCVADVDCGRKVRERLQVGEQFVALLYTRFFEFDHRRVVEILKRVLSQEPSVRVLVAGVGICGDEQLFLDHVEEAGLSSSLIYVGWAQQDELAGYFAATDLAVCPFEDTLLNRARCPAKVADLMSAGLAIVADDVGEVGQYIEHLVSGYLVAPGDTRAFADGVVRLLRDEELRNRLGAEAARRVVTEFAWPRLAAVAETAYTLPASS